jgi:NAD(P)-dependent dehydrogenase (short-subunit alcohol dehydrogenase family)
MTETVLVVGATGNIGVSAVKGALSAGRNVLAIVRSQNSADKLIKHIGSSDGITFAEADVTKEDGVKSVVDRVRAGELPAFQHVWCSGKFSLDMSELLGDKADGVGSWRQLRDSTAVRADSRDIPSRNEDWSRLRLLYVFRHRHSIRLKLTISQMLISLRSSISLSKTM